MKLIANIKDINSFNSLSILGVDCFLLSDRKFSSSPNGIGKNRIRKIVKLVHKNGREVIAKVDRLYQESEIEDLINYLLFLERIQFDYVLFSDVAIIQIIKENNLKLKTIYAPETLLTNSYDVKQLKADGISNCVISKDITLDNVYDIIKDNKEYCYYRFHGPVLISYSKRRFISIYLGYKKQRLNSYYLQEESRNNKMPIVEKNTGTWLYYGCLESLDKFNEMRQMPFAGLIIDNILYDDEYTIEVLKIYNSELTYQEKMKALKQLDNRIEYISISEIKKTQLDKE